MNGYPTYREKTMTLTHPTNTEFFKFRQKLKELNSIIDFVEKNERNENLKERYIVVLRHHKALLRDMERKDRKIPVNLPSVCEVTGEEVNTIREKQPPFKLEENIGLFQHEPDSDGMFLSDRINGDIEHNSYSHLLNNYSAKSVKKMLGRKIVLADLSSIEENLTLIIEIFKHKDYYKKYFNISTFQSKLPDIRQIVDKI
jgi:hypothetical protein|tara:strand:+ start:141 stop:740 length:600 start_codon:yes stop_codon:yes gene_type:complete